DRVLAEADRVLKPRGRFAVSDAGVRGEVPADGGKRMEIWVGGLSGALGENEYPEELARTGFESDDIEAARVYRVEEAREFVEAAGLNAETVGPQMNGKFISAFVRAAKPAAQAACCGPTCCA